MTPQRDTKATLSIFYGRQVLRRAEMVPDKKKIVDIQAFFYFFLRHSKNFGDFFFTKLVGVLLKNHQNLLKITWISRRQPASPFLFFIFFL